MPYLTIDELSAIFSQRLFGIWAVICILVVVIHRKHKARKQKIPGIPSVTGPKYGDFRPVLEKANAKYFNQPYLAEFADPTVVVPFHCVEELKNLPDAQISPNGSQFTRFLGPFTNSGMVSKELAMSIKYDLPMESSAIFPTLQGEIQHTVTERFPLCANWTPITVQADMAQIVGQVIGRFVVGAPLNRDKSWLQASIDHAIAVVMFSFWLRQFPEFLRPLVAPFMPYKRALDASKKGIRDAVEPMISKELSGTGSQIQDSGSSLPESGRLVKWLLKRYKDTGNPQLSPRIIGDHNTICFAAIHGPSFLLVQALIDLAAYPQYMTTLREEVDRELAQTPFEKWTVDTTSKLEFMDAFCKESARMNPQGLLAWLRKTHKPLKLSTGHIIPADTLISGTNPFFFPDAFPHIESPNHFEPERWMRDRSDPHPDASFKFGSATLDSLIFSTGRHACPGRVFGTALVKSILAYIITRWDIRLGGGRKGRPENVYMDFQVLPPVPPMGDVFLEIRARSEPSASG